MTAWLSLTVRSGSTTMLSNTMVLRTMRLMRLFRMCRMARLMRKMPDLMIIIRGVHLAARSVFFTLVLIGFIVFVFAIAFRQLTRETDIGELYFATVLLAMSSLLLRAVLP